MLYWKGRGSGQKESTTLLCLVAQAGDMDRACKHVVLGARAGCEKSLEKVKEGYMRGLVTKDEYERTLRACDEHQSEMKSDARDIAAASRVA